MELLDLGSVILPFILLFFVYHIEKTLIKIKKKNANTTNTQRIKTKTKTMVHVKSTYMYHSQLGKVYNNLILFQKRYDLRGDLTEVQITYTTLTVPFQVCFLHL